MKTTLITIGAIMILLLGYLITINAMAISHFVNNTNQIQENKTFNGMFVELGIGNKVDVSVTRERWYGIIIESYNGDNNLNNLYLFNQVRIPINVNGSNWVFTHWCVLGLMLWIMIVMFGLDIYFSITKNERREENALGY